MSMTFPPLPPVEPLPSRQEGGERGQPRANEMPCVAVRQDSPPHIPPPATSAPGTDCPVSPPGA